MMESLYKHQYLLFIIIIIIIIIVIIIQERFINFWRKSIWPNKPAREPNHSKQLRTYRYFKKSFTTETYLNRVKNVNHQKALCQQTSSQTLMCEVGRCHKLPYMNNDSASFVLPKNLNLSYISIFC